MVRAVDDDKSRVAAKAGPLIITERSAWTAGGHLPLKQTGKVKRPAEWVPHDPTQTSHFDPLSSATL